MAKNLPNVLNYHIINKQFHKLSIYLNVPNDEVSIYHVATSSYYFILL